MVRSSCSVVVVRQENQETLPMTSEDCLMKNGRLVIVCSRCPTVRIKRSTGRCGPCPFCGWEWADAISFDAGKRELCFSSRDQATRDAIEKAVADDE